MKKILLVVMMVVAGMSLYSLYSWATTKPKPLISIPLPEDSRIVPPDPNLPPEIKAFSGKWSGRWEWQDRRNNDGVDAIFIVEKINGKDLQAIVVTASDGGDSEGWKISRGWERTTANFSKTDEGLTLFVGGKLISQESKHRVKGDQLIGISEDASGRGTIIVTMVRIQ